MKSYASGLSFGRWGPAQSLILDHAMTQEVITINPDGKTAQGRHRALIARAQHDVSAEGDPEQDTESPYRNFWEGMLILKYTH